MSTIINNTKETNTLCDKEISIKTFFHTLLFQSPSLHITEALAKVFANNVKLINKDLYCITIEICKPVEEMFLKWKETILNNEATKPLFFQLHECSTMKELVKKHVREGLKTLFTIENFTNEAEADVTLNAKINLFTQNLTENYSFKKQDHKKRKQTPVIHEDVKCNSHFISFTLKRQSVIIQGHYNKTKRTVLQTQWVSNDTLPCHNKTVSEPTSSSVEQAIAFVLVDSFQCESYNFHAAGREDRDVRMLGEGRPFVVILTNPKVSCSKNTQELTSQANFLQETINTNSSVTGVVVSKLTINSLQVTPNRVYKQLQILSEEKQKIYGCLCYSPFKTFTTAVLLQALEPLIQKDCIIQQKTPLRVAHRRCGITRVRHIRCEEVSLLYPQYFILQLNAQAGTYIKEFIHGDFLRTEPSITSLLNTPIVLLKLDVLNLIF